MVLNAVQRSAALHLVTTIIMFNSQGLDQGYPHFVGLGATFLIDQTKEIYLYWWYLIYIYTIWSDAYYCLVCWPEASGCSCSPAENAQDVFRNTLAAFQTSEYRAKLWVNDNTFPTHTHTQAMIYISSAKLFLVAVALENGHKNGPRDLRFNNH